MVHRRRQRKRSRGYSSGEDGTNSITTARYSNRNNNDFDSINSSRPRKYSNTSTRSRYSSESSSSGDESTVHKLRYAGAKFNSTPPASMLPLPPSHWFDDSQTDEREMLDDIASQLRSILKVSDC